MLPVIEAFMAAHHLPDVTVVADAGMISEANQKAIEAAGLSFILGMKIPDVPYQVAQWRREHPGEDIPDGHVFTQPWPAGPCRSAVTRSSTTSTGPTGRGARCAASTSRSPRPRRPSPAKPRSSGTGSSSSTAPTKSVNRELEARARDLAGLKGYITNLAACPDGTPVTAEFVIGAYHRLWQHRKELSACPSTTCGPGRSTTASATPSTPT